MLGLHLAGTSPDFAQPPAHRNRVGFIVDNNLVEDFGELGKRRVFGDVHQDVGAGRLRTELLQVEGGFTVSLGLPDP